MAATQKDILPLQAAITLIPRGTKVLRADREATQRVSKQLRVVIIATQKDIRRKQLVMVAMQKVLALFQTKKVNMLSEDGMCRILLAQRV